MNIEIVERRGEKIAVLKSDSVVIRETQDALDLLAEAGYQDASRIIIQESHLSPDFFDLKTRLAGDILQKFSNYRTRLAIVGDFTKYTSKSLKDFIRESNRQKHVIFIDSFESAIDNLIPVSKNKHFDISVQRFNEFASEYTERFMNIESYLPSVDIFCSLIKPAKPAILELACGPGNFTRYLKNMFPESEIMAIDLAPKMLEIAKSLVQGVDFRIMDVRNISSIDNIFDAIMCSFCLPFLSAADAQKLISDCSGRLKKGGVIYISTMEGDESMAGFEPTSFSGESEIFFNYHRQTDLESALIRNGYSVNDFRRQDYHDADGGILTDMIFIATKTK